MKFPIRYQSEKKSSVEIHRLHKKTVRVDRPKKWRKLLGCSSNKSMSSIRVKLPPGIRKSLFLNYLLGLKFRTLIVAHFFSARFMFFVLLTRTLSKSVRLWCCVVREVLCAIDYRSVKAYFVWIRFATTLKWNCYTHVWYQ